MATTAVILIPKGGEAIPRGQDEQREEEEKSGMAGCEGEREADDKNECMGEEKHDTEGDDTDARDAVLRDVVLAKPSAGYERDTVCPLQDVPAEVLDAVLRFLAPVDWLSCARVDWRWNSVSRGLIGAMSPLQKEATIMQCARAWPLTTLDPLPLDGEQRRLLVRAAVGAGRTDVLQRIEDLATPGSRLCQYTCEETVPVCRGAKSDERVRRRRACQWCRVLVVGAARQGHTDVLKRLRGDGCPWDERTAAAAISSGHLDLLIWACDHGCPLGWTAFDLAARNGHAHVAAWLYDEAGREPIDVTGHEMALLGHLGMLMWFRERRLLPLDPLTCASAAWGGHLEVLQWLRANYFSWDSRTCEAAAKGGHLATLKWAHDNGCPWDERTCSQAAKWGHLELITWAHSNGCPWDKDTCSKAKQRGHLDVLAWARANGCPDDGDDDGILQAGIPIPAGRSNVARIGIWEEQY